MDRNRGFLPRQSGNIIFRQQRLPSVTNGQDEIRPIPMVEPLHHRSDDEIPDHEPQYQQHHPRPDQSSYDSSSHTSPRDPSSPSPRRSSSYTSHVLPGPLYQTRIPALDPNHYDLHHSTICFCIPLTMRTPVNRWRARRRSVKDLHEQQDELREEHLRLKEIESKYQGKLPQYEELRKDDIRERNEGMERPRIAVIPRDVRNQD